MPQAKPHWLFYYCVIMTLFAHGRVLEGIMSTVTNVIGLAFGVALILRGNAFAILSVIELSTFKYLYACGSTQLRLLSTVLTKLAIYNSNHKFSKLFFIVKWIAVFTKNYNNDDNHKQYCFDHFQSYLMNDRNIDSQTKSTRRKDIWDVMVSLTLRMFCY